MPRRLVNRGGGGDVQTLSQGPAAPEPCDVTYEPLAFPLNEVAIKKLGELSQNRDTLAYQNQLKDALRNLGHGVSDLQDRLREQRARLEQFQSRRHQRGVQPAEERLEKHLPGLEADVDALTRRSEAATRSAIDQRFALEDDAAVLSELYTAASINRRPPPGEAEDESDHTPPPSTIDSLRELRARKKAEYEAIPNYERYARHNDYVSFKKLWHDGATGDDGTPLPDASKWFRADGTPVMSAGVQGAAAADDDEEPEESDEDVAVSREVLSLKCPLTLRPMEEPLTNKQCKHTFERSAIIDYLSDAPAKQCPQTGCSQVRIHIFFFFFCPLTLCCGGKKKCVFLTWAAAGFPTEDRQLGLLPRSIYPPQDTACQGGRC